MSGFGHKHYVPVLKGKRAEFPALEHLKSNESATPLIECIPGAENDLVPKKMSAFWPNDHPYFIDAIFADDEGSAESEAAAHPLTACFAAVQSKGQVAIPVTGTGRSPAYQSAARKICADQKNGVALRLTTEDFEDEEELVDAIESLLSYLKVQKSHVDLILDADSVADMSAATLTQTHRSNLELIPDLASWRTLTVVAGAFPMGLAPLTRDAWNTAPRTDWLAWNSLVTGSRKPARLPAYGDYSIANPDLPPTGRATIVAQLRYSTPGLFLIWKGRNVFTHATGFGQFIGICKDLVTRPEYRGAAFSMGDEEISVKAATGDSPGNAETWRKIGTNHHLETVLEQIASLP